MTGSAPLKTSSTDPSLKGNMCSIFLWASIAVYIMSVVDSLAPNPCLACALPSRRYVRRKAGARLCLAHRGTPLPPLTVPLQLITNSLPIPMIILPLRVSRMGSLPTPLKASQFQDIFGAKYARSQTMISTLAGRSMISLQTENPCESVMKTMLSPISLPLTCCLLPRTNLASFTGCLDSNLLLRRLLLLVQAVLPSKVIFHLFTVSECFNTFLDHRFWCIRSYDCKVTIFPLIQPILC